jgi:hypothetical protein
MLGCDPFYPQQNSDYMFRHVAHAFIVPYMYAISPDVFIVVRNERKVLLHIISVRLHCRHLSRLVVSRIQHRFTQARKHPIDSVHIVVVSLLFTAVREEYDQIPPFISTPCHTIQKKPKSSLQLSLACSKPVPHPRGKRLSSKPLSATRNRSDRRRESAVEVVAILV